MATPYISVVIPAYNEEACLDILYDRLFPVLDALNKPYEVIFVNDGSTDKTEQILKSLYDKRPQQIRIINFNGNFGQHMAIMAGFECVRGEVIINMDADLQNPPEEIPNLMAEIEKGHDVINTYRLNRKDNWWRRFVSKMHNALRAHITPRIKMKDQGCMLRAYRRNIIDLVVSTEETNTFIPALALHYAANPTEIGIQHEDRPAGESHYNFYSLIRYNFDLVTGFSLVPLEWLTLTGIVVLLGSFAFLIYAIVHFILSGHGMIILFALLCVLNGIIIMGLGILGEYLGRISQQVRKRPRFVINNMVEDKQNQ